MNLGTGFDGPVSDVLGFDTTPTPLIYCCGLWATALWSVGTTLPEMKMLTTTKMMIMKMLMMVIAFRGKKLCTHLHTLQRLNAAPSAPLVMRPELTRKTEAHWLTWR